MSQEWIYTIVFMAWLAGAAAFVIGAMVIAAEAKDPLGYAIAFVAMAFGAMNVVGGYVVTDRMLQMFKKKPAAAKAESKS